MYLPSRKACLELGVHPNTLRRWANNGKIRYIKTVGGQRLYDCSSLEQCSSIKKNYCYCRVSSYNKKEELDKQIQLLQSKYPNHILIKDIGSGDDFKRKQFLFLLEECAEGRVDNIVVVNKESLCNTGIELLEWFFSRNAVNLIVLEPQNTTSEKNLVSDLLSVITAFTNKRQNKKEDNDE